MTRWYPLEPADADFLTTAPQVHRFPIRVQVPPERVWESLQSDASLSAWGPAIHKLTWTTSRPFGVGTTRDVVLPLNAVTIRERFFRWDEGEGYSFAAYECNRPLFRRFAEDYVVEADGTGTLLTWIVAIEPNPKLNAVMRFSGPLNRVAFGQAAASGKKYFAKNP